MRYKVLYYNAETGEQRPYASFHMSLPPLLRPKDIARCIPERPGGEEIWLDDQGRLIANPFLPCAAERSPVLRSTESESRCG
jgi:hypothetical protein